MRLIYVSTYVVGFDKGFTHGCKTAVEIGSSAKSAGLPGEECIAREPGHPKNLDEYVELITKFYAAYPTDRYVPIRRVLDGLSNARNLTIQRIHQYSGNNSMQRSREFLQAADSHPLPIYSSQFRLKFAEDCALGNLGR